MIWLGAHLIALGVLVSRPGLTRLSSTTRFSVLWRRGRVNAILARWEAAGPSALMWKNVRTVLRTQPLQRFVPCAVAAPVLAAVTALPQFHQASGFAAGISTAWLALLVVTGSMFVRNDLRLDLPSLAVIVAAPVPIRRVAAAEVMASTLVLTACQAGCGTLLIGALLFRSDLPTPRLVIAAAWLMILPMLPALNSSMLASQNLLAIRVPRLVRLGMRRPGEVGSTGLAYLAMLATAAAFVAVAILPLLGAVIVLGVTHGAGAEIRYVVSYATAVMLAWAQARLAVHVLGGQLERRAMTLCEA